MSMQPLLRFKTNGYGFKTWEKTLLSQIATVTMGQSPNSDAYNDDYDGLPLIQGNADIVDGFTKPSRYTTEITKRCQKNDVILSVRAPVGELGIATEECCIGRGVCAIRANDKSETAFIYQLLQAKKKQWKTLEQGSTFTAVSGEDVKAFEVVVPTKEEQQKIAAFFTALGDKIQNNKEKLLLLSKLKASLAREILFHKIAFSSASSWMEVKLSDVSSIVRERKSSDSSLYVGTEDLIKNFGGLKKVRGGSASGIGFEKNDILISNIRPYLKKLWMSDEEGISSADVIVFRSKKIEPSLLKHILSTDKFFEHVAKGYKGSKMPRGDKDQILTYEFPIPSTDGEQKKISHFLDLLDVKIACLRKQGEILQRLKQAFMQQMFI